MIEINDELQVDPREISFVASRSSGPGGQNVNKVNSRVTLRFDIEASESLSPEHKDLLRQRLSNRISKEGVLQISAAEQRRQGANRDAALSRFVALLQEALSTDPERRPTRTPRRVVERRLEHKRRVAEKKRRRSRPVHRDE